VPELYSRREAYNVREKGSDAVRTNFAAHMVSEPSRGSRGTRAW
jgi:ectoine hydroxylase